MVASNDPGGTAHRAQVIYARLQPMLQPQHNGKFLVVNVDTGEYELDASDFAASDRAAARWSSDRLFTFRVGRRAAYRIAAA